MRPERYEVIQGAALIIRVTLRDANGAVITTYAGTETLAVTLATVGNNALVGTPTAAWANHSAGTIDVTVSAALTAALAPGDYTLTLTLDDAGTVVWPYQATVAVQQAAVDGTAPAAPGTRPTGTAPAKLATVYCTDEDIACRAPQDFWVLCPGHFRIASGSDGLFTGSDAWALQSESLNFATAGVTAGQVVQITLPRKVGKTPGGELFAVDSVSGQTCWLRRLGLPASVGEPPAKGEAVTGVVFEVRTFARQIDVSSYEANKFFGVDVNVPNKAPSRLYDARELQQYTVLTVLKRAYIAGEKTAQGDFKLKLADVATELEDLKSRLTLHWGSLALGQPANSVFSARTRR